VGRLLRLKGAIDALVGPGEVKPDDLEGLAAGYGRMRKQVADLVKGSGLEAEFEALFPELGPVTNKGPGPGGLIDWHHEATSTAKNAKGLLAQLAGWVDGLIAEETMSERIQAEAAERVKREQPGFDAV